MNDRDFSDALVWIANSPTLAIDTETSGLHPHEYDVVLGISVANEHKAIYFPLRHPSSHNLSYDQGRNFIALLSQPRKRILFHNAIFDWPCLRNEGWSYPQPWASTWDTMVVAWLLDENEPKKLEEQVSLWLDANRAKEQKERQKKVKKIGWENTTFEQMQSYATWDARNTFDLYQVQQGRISKDASLACALVREHRFLQVCDEMISNGVLVNFEQAQRKLAECDAGIEKLEIEYPGLNFDSPLQIGRLVFTDEGLEDLPGWGIVPTVFTKTGQPSTDKDTLLNYLEFEPRINDIFDYRKLRKARSTYYVPLVERQGRDGRVHAWYRPHGTKPGRMSCSDPNLQTLPHEETLPGIKDCFLAAEGYSLMEYDLSQAELRVAAYYSDDEVLRAHLAQGDVHAATARAMFGTDEDVYRSVSKNLNFGALYGIGAKKFVKTARRKGDRTITEDIARQHLGQWRNLYEGVTRAAKEAEAIAIERPINLWPVGRYRRFNTAHGRFDHPKDAFNSIVQGGVGEYVKQLMMELREPALSAGVRIVLNVHDSIVTEVPSGMEEMWTRTVRQVAARCNPFQIEMPVGEKVW